MSSATASARSAGWDDIPALEALYSGLLAEMVALKEIWALTDGLAEPVATAIGEHLDDPRDSVYLGEYDGVPVGFLVWRADELLPQAEGVSIATIRLIYTEPGVRGVGVGEAMMALFFEAARQRGIVLYDVVVPPGHRHAKNFFEANGFKARRIVMHRDDRP